MAFLQLSHVFKKIKGNVVLNDFSFEQQAGENIAIAGETGSGKTTALKIIGGLEQADEGLLIFNNEKINGPLDQLIPGHAGTGYLSQHFELWNNYYVHELLTYAGKISAEELQRIAAVCRIETLLSRRTDELSGGERQRVALAKILTTRPRLLLLDEPFSNLDAEHKKIIREVLKECAGAFGMSMIMATHELEDMLGWAHRLIILQDGRILQDGSPQEVYRNPVNFYIASLTGLCNQAFAKDFPGLVNPGGKPMFIFRPEALSVNSSGDFSFEAELKHVSFAGSYFVNIVAFRDYKFYLRSQDEGVVGDQIPVTLDPDRLTWID